MFSIAFEEHVFLINRTSKVNIAIAARRHRYQTKCKSESVIGQLTFLPVATYNANPF